MKWQVIYWNRLGRVWLVWGSYWTREEANLKATYVAESGLVVAVEKLP